MQPVSFSVYEQRFTSKDPEIADLNVLTSLTEEGVPQATSCWNLSLWERLQVLVHGKIYVYLQCRSHPPIAVDCDRSYVNQIEEGYRKASMENLYN